jgi:hypothetical protein
LPSLSIFDNPEHWRERAEEARHVAEQLEDTIARAAVLRIAEWPSSDFLRQGAVAN